MNIWKETLLTFSAIGFLSGCNSDVIKTYENTNQQLTQITINKYPITECHPASKKSMKKCNEE